MSQSSNPLSRRLRWSLRAVATAAIAAANALSLAPVAGAKDYHVHYCRSPDGSLITNSDWKPMSDRGVPLPVTAECGPGYMYLNLGMEQRYAGAFAGFGLELPDGLKATFIEGDRWVWLGPGPDYYASPRYQFLTGVTTDKPWDTSTPNVREECILSAGCGGYAWNQPGSPDGRILTGLAPTSFIGFALSCSGSYICGAANDERGHLRINNLDITVHDPYVPEASGATGSLLQPGARAGTETVSATTTDRGAGVYEAYLRVDGVEVSRARPADGPACKDLGSDDSKLEFSRLQPCPLSVGVSFALNTTRFADGKHQVELWVRDAADNHKQVVAQEVLIDNVPPPAVSIKPTITGATLAAGLRPGDAVAAQNGAWVGANLTFAQRWQRSTVVGTWIDIPNGTGGTYRVGNDDIGSQLRVVVTAANGDGAVEAASEATGKVTDGKTVQVQSVPGGGGGNGGTTTVVPGPTNGGGGNPATGQLVVDREQRTVDVKHGAKVVITGRLVDADGNPIADASVDVFEQIAVTAAPWNKVDTIKTDSQGGYVYRPKTTSSRRLRFAFSELRGDASYRATREVFVSVTAGMTISARSKLVSRRGLIRIGGQVIVDRLPSGGAVVEVQVLDAGVWRTVATRRANKVGKWSFKHRLRGASATRFTFRARLRTAGDLPSAEAKSAALKSARAMRRRGLGDEVSISFDGVRPSRVRRVARLVGAVLIGAMLAGVSATPAAAEEQPSILKAYGLDWIERVREDAWPQPKEQRPIICLLDTGVAVTPDTPDDNPLGPIVARLALDGGTGLPQGTEFEHLHGTQMASVIAAPRNGYGTVGVFPQARIVSVRVTEGAATFITPRAVALGANACTRWASANGKVRVASLVMAESNYDQRESDVEPWKFAADWVEASGGLLIAAVGNAENARLVAPVSAANVVSVGAGDDAGELCGFAPYGTETALLGPGCSLDARHPWPSGSSAATAAVGAFAAAIITGNPARNPEDVRAYLEGTAVIASGSNARRFSGMSTSAALFPGLVVDVPAAPVPAAQPSRPPSVVAPSPTPGLVESSDRTVLWRPIVNARWERGRLTVWRTDLRASGRVVIAISTSGSRMTFENRNSGRVKVMRLKRKPRVVEVWIRGGSGRASWRSLIRRVRVLTG